MENSKNNVATATETKNIVENLANGAAPTKTATAAPTKTEKKAEVKVEKPAAKVAKPKVEKPAAKAATPKKAEKATATPKKAEKATAAPKKADKKVAAPTNKKAADKKATAAPKKVAKATATPKKAEKKVAAPTNKKAATSTNKKAAAPKKVEVKEVNPAIEKARRELQKRELAYILGKVVVAGLEQRLSREMKAEIENAKAQGKRVQPRYSTYHSAALSKETLETLRNMGIDYEQDCNGKGHRFRFFVPRKGTKAYKTLFGE